MIISFALTEKELLAGLKTVTRRRWAPRTAARFKQGTIHQAWNAETNGAAWVFNSWRSFPVLARGANDARWPITSLMVWDKERMGAGTPRGLRPRYELCALFIQEGFKIQNRSLPDIWPEPLPYKKPTGHKSEKPVGLIKKIIRESGSNSILDPFLGSGTTAVAAKELGRKCIGIEIEERWCEVAAKRAEQAQAGG